MLVLAGRAWGLEQSRDDRNSERELLVIADFWKGQGGPTFVRGCEWCLERLGAVLGTAFGMAFGTVKEGARWRDGGVFF